MAAGKSTKYHERSYNTLREAVFILPSRQDASKFHVFSPQKSKKKSLAYSSTLRACRRLPYFVRDTRGSLLPDAAMTARGVLLMRRSGPFSLL